MWSEIAGSVGVGLLLVAFILNLLKKLSARHPAYLTLNIIGCSITAWYAWAGEQIPFVILEIVWGLAALVKLVSVVTQEKTPAEAGVHKS